MVKSSGSWAVPLSTARTTDGSDYAQITDDSVVTLLAQGISANLTSQVTTTVSAAQPVSTITLGESSNTTAQTTTTTSTASGSATTDSSTASGSSEVALLPELGSTDASSTSDTTSRGGLGDLLETESTSISAVLELAVVEQNPDQKPIITTMTPTITGVAAPNVVVSIEVNSETKINAQLTTDANGQFVLDIAKLSKELEPGEHSVTYSYVDPSTGQTVTKTQNFTVDPEADSSTQIAQATTKTTTTRASSSPSPSPFGSGNPFPIGGATSSSKTATSSTKTSTSSSRVTVPSTSSGVPVSGSVTTTFALVLGGLFFLVAGVWSYWIAQQLEEELA